MTSLYSLYQPDIFEYLQRGRSLPGGKKYSPDEFFRSAIGEACKDIAASFECTVNFSAARMEDSRVYWARDIPRIDIAGSKIANHFKQAAFLTYWLRRRIVIEKAFGSGPVGLKEQQYFREFSNEICALIVGYRHISNAVRIMIKLMTLPPCLGGCSLMRGCGMMR